MKKTLEKLLKETGIELNKTEIINFSATYEKLVVAKSQIKSKTEKAKFNKVLKLFTEFEDETKNNLFPNQIPNESFGLPSAFTDNYKSLDIKDIDHHFKIIQARYNKKRKNEILIDHNEKFGFKFNDQVDEINNAEDVFDIIKNYVKSGTVLQHYCALFNFAMLQKSFIFRHIPIDSILETFLKKPKNGYFRQTTRENFTKSIRMLEKMYLRTPVKSKGKKGSSISGFINVPLLDFRLSIENKSGDVILKFIGEIFGGMNAGKFRGRVFPQGIFDLDSRTEGARIKLAFKLCTRFDQLNHQDIKWTRKKLIEQAGLINTDKKNKNEASKLLIDTLTKLQKIQCIKGFSPNKIKTKDNKEIVIESYFKNSLIN